MLRQFCVTPLAQPLKSMSLSVSAIILCSPCLTIVMMMRLVVMLNREVVSKALKPICQNSLGRRVQHGSTIDEQLFSFWQNKPFLFFSEALYSIYLFNLDTKPELLLNLLIGHLHALVLVRPTLLVHLRHWHKHHFSSLKVCFATVTIFTWTALCLIWGLLTRMARGPKRWWDVPVTYLEQKMWIRSSGTDIVHYFRTPR